MPRRPIIILLLALAVLVACNNGSPEAAAPGTSQRVAAAPATATLAPTFTPAAATVTATATPIPARTPTATPSPSNTPVPITPTPNITSTPPDVSPSPAPDPFLPYYIETIAARPYGEGPIGIGVLLEETPAFRRYAISYPSDGLRITGYLNLPKGPGPFPIIILNHGYYPPEHYQAGDGTREAADFLAQHGYLTLASDYRNYAGSDDSDNFFRLGFVVDIMNLLASLDTLPAGWADTERVGMWGHSMGGGVTINVVALAGDALDAAVIYGGMSGDMSDATRHVLGMWQRPDFTVPVVAWGGARRTTRCLRSHECPQSPRSRPRGSLDPPRDLRRAGSLLMVGETA